MKKKLKRVWKEESYPGKCKFCSYCPTSMNDFCDNHRPRTDGEMRVGDWVSLGEGHLLEVVEIMEDGRILWCSDSLSEIDPKHVKEIRTPNGEIYR